MSIHFLFFRRESTWKYLSTSRGIPLVALLQIVSEQWFYYATDEHQTNFFFPLFSLFLFPYSSSWKGKEKMFFNDHDRYVVLLICLTSLLSFVFSFSSYLTVSCNSPFRRRKKLPHFLSTSSWCWHPDAQ